MKLACLCILVVACGENSPGPQIVDAPEAPEASGIHTVFLAFDGVSILKGTDDDATTNTTKTAAADGTVSPLFAGDSTRATRIDSIVAEIRTGLTPYDIKLVTTRPDSGPYDMIVFGGTAQELGYADNIALFALAPEDCDNVEPSSVGFVFEDADPFTNTPYEHAQMAMAVLALEHGLPVSREASDCLCYDVDLTKRCDHTQACSFGGAGKTAYDLCDNAPTFDPNQAMLTEFGAHP